MGAKGRIDQLRAPGPRIGQVDPKFFKHGKPALSSGTDR
jgi:hypothetical protein